MNLSDLLGTKNKKEQAEKVGQMIRALNMPVIDMVIRYDGMADQVNVSILGGNLSFEVAHRILDLARKNLQQEEVKASIDQQAKQNGGQPEHPDLPVEDNAEPSPELNAPADAGE